MKKPTKKELKQREWEKNCNMISADLDKVFSTWDDANNKGKKWEHSLGEHSRTIRKNLFGAGFFAAEDYWKKRLKKEGWKKP